MKILILGIDGYIGRPLALHLEKQGHDVWGQDDFSRRKRARHCLTPITPKDSTMFLSTRLLVEPLEHTDFSWLPEMDVIVHLAEQPSAPWSMVDKKNAASTQMSNVAGTLRLLWLMKEMMPNAHLVKIGSMGEYGTPNFTIPEGFIDHGPLKGMMFPRQPGSFYHLSKVFDSMNIEFACRMWGLRSTDIMQGVVFGLNYWDSKSDITRFDYDQYFGTVLNRFCAQALAEYPLTVYGRGEQTRGFLPLSDSIDCLTLAIENPPEIAEYRVFNQYAEMYTVRQLAETVKDVAYNMGLKNTRLESIENPRIEKENHFYESTNQNLRDLGYDPKWELEEEIGKLMETIFPYGKAINTDVIAPTTTWS